MYLRFLLSVCITLCLSVQANIGDTKHLGNNERVYAQGFSKKEFARVVTAGTYIFVRALDKNGNCHVQANGIIGASIGAFLGKIAVSVIGHGLICIIGGLTGPLAPVTIIVLESTFGAAIEAGSMAGAVAGGITLGALTGPV